MAQAIRVSFLIGILALCAACQTTQQELAASESIAMETALRRGRFDLGCPSATGVLLSDDVIQPALQGPWVSGIERLEYTIGIQGCGKRTSLVVMCQAGSDTCFAANPNREYWNNGYHH